MVKLDKLKELFNSIPHWDYQSYVSKRCNFEQNYFESRGSKERYRACIVIPHSGNRNCWLVRINNHKTFDKWSNCDYEYYYDTADEAVSKLVEFYENIIGGLY